MLGMRRISMELGFDDVINTRCGFRWFGDAHNWFVYLIGDAVSILLL